MTDRYAGFVVTLADDVRQDDAEAIVTALRMVKGVISVAPVVADVDLHMAAARVNQRWQQRLLTLINAPEDVDAIDQTGRLRRGKD